MVKQKTKRQIIEEEIKSLKLEKSLLMAKNVELRIKRLDAMLHGEEIPADYFEVEKKLQALDERLRVLYD